MSKKILFYYHHFGGFGHGMRIYSICKALKSLRPAHKLIVINSGTPQAELNIERYAKVIDLPYFKAKKGLFSGLYSTDVLEVTFKKRRTILRFVADKFRPDIAIFEHFPFGRDSLEGEIVEFARYLKQKNTLIYSSVRDIINQKISLDKLRKRLELFNGVFVHSDKSMGFITNFRKPEFLRKKLILTDRILSLEKKKIIDKQKIKNRLKCTHKRLILISIGGGIDGIDIIEKMIITKRQIDKRLKTLFLISTGTSVQEQAFAKLKEQAKKAKDVIIRKFIPSYINYVNAADLYITMGGYNSINNSLFTGVKTIVFPRQTDNEQKLRTSYFRKFLKILDFQTRPNYIASWIGKIIKNNSQIRYKGEFKGAIITSRLLDVVSSLNYIKIRLTTNCNANCDMCSWRKKKEKLCILRVKQTIDQAKALNVRIINFTGGEPTLYPGFYELLEYTKKQGFVISVSTNGICDNGTLTYLSKFSDTIDVSLDSHLESINDRIRGKTGAFRMVMDSIKYLCERNINLHINVTVRPDNFNSIHKMIPLLSNYINSISFTLVDTSLNSFADLKFSRNDLYCFYLNEVPHILKECINTKIKLRITPFFRNLESKEALRIVLINRKYYLKNLPSIFIPDFSQPCDRIKKQIRINSDGEISICCYLDDFPIDLGNINKGDFLSIISSEKYYNFIKDSMPKRKFCKDCMAGYRAYSKLLSNEK